MRDVPFRYLPLELSLRNVPGYERIPVGDLRIVGRKDVFAPQGDADVGGRRGPRWSSTSSAFSPIRRAVFQVTNVAPGNHVEIRMGKMPARSSTSRARKRAASYLDPGEPFRVRRQKWATFYVYKMVVTSRTGRVRHWVREYPPNSCPDFVQDGPARNENFYVGAALAYLGTGAQLEDDVYELQWGNTTAPPNRPWPARRSPCSPACSTVAARLDGGRRRAGEPRLPLAGRKREA